MTTEELQIILAYVIDEIATNNYKIDCGEILGNDAMRINTLGENVGSDLRFKIEPFQKDFETSYKILNELASALPHIDGKNYNIDFKLQLYLTPR